MKAAARREPRLDAPKPTWELCLYVAGKSQRSLDAFVNLKRFCLEHLTAKHTIEVVDVIAHPHLAKTDNIVALPTLVRRSPKPVRRVIGDLSDTARLLTLLDM